MLDRIRILGAGFTKGEFELYNFDRLSSPELATGFLSHKENDQVFRRILNGTHQKFILEDKWVTQGFLDKCGLPVPFAYGLYHPQFGRSYDGEGLCEEKDFARVFAAFGSKKVVFKPRGGRQGRHIVVAKIVLDDQKKAIAVERKGERISLSNFLAELPDDASKHYGGGYHGWIVQGYIEQHESVSRIYPGTVNTVRLVTFLSSENKVDYHFAIIRLGRDGQLADNWSAGGISVDIDLNCGILGKGILKPKYGGRVLSEHPNSGVRFCGLQLPFWGEILNICANAALQFSGVRSIGWDIAISKNGPLIVEANAEWDLAMVQAHSSRGYLNPEVRSELSKFGATFTDRLPTVTQALFRLGKRRFLSSRFGKYLLS
ncbi:sugar-transfer associated ATP-grasp domain-containing protein [Halochromatium glycolicum]|nr:sugar-transfer associated ATP-grasp domain-containing protein [Halochromatium glycolicum]